MRRRAVAHLTMPILHQLLQLPDNLELLHVAPGMHGLSLAVVLTGDDIPELPPECSPWELSPSIEIADDGRYRLDLGVDRLRQSHAADTVQWGYGYVDSPGAVVGPVSELRARRTVDGDYSAVLHRRDLVDGTPGPWKAVETR
jgi:hypothetical protein